ncbi:MAG: alpha-amylase family protein [Candidatus Omnitrophota bacterium]
MERKLHFARRTLQLDFHTSGAIPDVGGKFDGREFVRRLKNAHIQSVNIFTRCHHGYCYYPSAVGPVHPGLKSIDLLGEQIKALSEAGLDYALYTSIAFDEYTAEQHPEWCMQDKDGRLLKWATKSEEGLLFQPGWRFVCWNSPYREYFRRQVVELCERYVVKEMILDILWAPFGCCCRYCLAGMKERGLDPKSEADVLEYSRLTARDFISEFSDLIRVRHPKAILWFNGRLRLDGKRERGPIPELERMGHIGMESLPTGTGFGYDHFALLVRYFQNTGLPMVSQTCRFHLNWGDFGGLKPQAALDYECLRMVSFGVTCGVGDQLNPDGTMEKAAYELIGRTYAKVKTIEEYAYPSEPVDEAGVVIPYEDGKPHNFWDDIYSPIYGALRILMQMHIQFSFLDDASDFIRYPLIILPDNITLTDALIGKLESYLAGGGKILATGNSGLNAEGSFALPGIQLKALGRNPYEPYYIYPCGKFLEVLADFDYVVYKIEKPAVMVQTLDNSYPILLRASEPYFNRSWDHFCSHAQTPVARRSDRPEMIYNNRNIIYIAPRLFDLYHKYAYWPYREIVRYALNLLLGERLVDSNLPTTAEVTLRRNGRYLVINILNYVPQRRAANLDIVEDVFPLVDITLRVKTGKRIQRVFSPSDGTEFTFESHGGKTCFTVPRIDGYRMVVLEE